MKTKLALEINKVCATQKKGQFGAVVITATTPAMLKTNNPYVGRVIKLTRYTNCAIGTSYTKTIEARGARCGVEVIEYGTAPNNCGAFLDEKQPFCRKHPTSGSTYFQFLYRKNTTDNAIYLVDGRKASEREVAEIKSFFSKKNTCKKQLEYGLSEKEVVEIRQPHCENVLLIDFGNGVQFVGAELGKYQDWVLK